MSLFRICFKNKMGEYIGLEDEPFGGLEDFCDAVLKTEDGCSFKVNQAFLAKNSAYFRSMFLFCRRNGSKAEFSLPFSGHTVKQILQYIYNSKILLKEDNIMEVLQASDYFLLDDLLLKCQKFMKEHLSLANCVKIFIASHTIGRLNLFKYTRSFIRVNFVRVLEQPTNDLADIPLELFKTLLEDDNLNIPDETHVCRAVEKWIGNCAERQSAAYDLLSTIRFRNPNSGLNQSLIKSHFLRNNQYLKGLKDIPSIAEASDFNFVFKSALSSIYPKIELTRLRQPKKLYLIATTWSFKLTDIYVTYNEDVWMGRKITSIPNYVSLRPTHIVVDQCLVYIFDSNLTDRGMMFDLLDKSWTKMQPMNHYRVGYAVFLVEQFIYAVGGVKDARLERYDTKSHVWKDLGQIIDCATTELMENKIYILGECPSSNIMTAKVYDTTRGQFSNIPAPDISASLWKFAMIEYANQLFVIGGSGDYAKSVQVYNPESRVWKKFQYLPNAYDFPHAKVFEDKLIVYGDIRSKIPPVFWNEASKAWETFESKTDLWNKNYLLHPIKDSAAITCLMNENLSYENKWTVFDCELL